MAVSEQRLALHGSQVHRSARVIDWLVTFYNRFDDRAYDLHWANLAGKARDAEVATLLQGASRPLGRYFAGRKLGYINV